jgi:hypothetical protein
VIRNHKKVFEERELKTKCPQNPKHIYKKTEERGRFIG